MLIVIDANVVFSALMKGGKPLKVFELNKQFTEFEFIAPEFLFFEIGKRIDKILTYSQFSKEEFTTVFSSIKRQIEPIPLTIFEDKVEEAESISPHLKDVSYIALSLKLNCRILFGDKGVNRCLPDSVITPSEAVDILLGKKTLS